MIRDHRANTVHKPSRTKQLVSGGNIDVIHDYGIVVRARNLYNPASHVLLIAGAYGYGTIAGVQICMEKADELYRFMQANGGEFECLISFSMTGSPPGLSQIEMIRPLRQRPRTVIEVPVDDLSAG
ncbi:hypothetical protein KIH74_18220 [Kineosporia sp. J2-2]|uniref:Uncharacterized protein n=1 Tax=Kineosporia corallincola TaxID=2835133 RepID=A0ABS5TIG1_9ACTN|nr:hypothetical protein [Kineosporia corallincola]MBT0770881.1 hypothetical protein [Kineosporia corallincola]